MLCIFCQRDSAGSTSVEHIIPESLGNEDHVLPPGVVCDDCNHYFGSKVEGPLLGSDYFRHARCWSATPSKRGRVPGVRALHPASKSLLEMVRDLDGSLHLFPAAGGSEHRWAEYLSGNRHGQLYVPVPVPPDHFLMSRFLAKVALEVLADRMLPLDGGLEFVATDGQLDPVRKFARYGSTQAWPFSRRELYAPETAFSGVDGEPYEVLHEFALLYTGERELHLVCAIYGVEYAINLGGPEIESYKRWLRQHDGRSFLDMLPSAGLTC